MNFNYTFDNFITGDSNIKGFKYAKIITENPGIKYNPLYIYGKSMTGKSHLVKAIQNKIHADFPDYKILYMPADEFQIDFIESLRKNHHEAFRNKYRNADVLIIENIEFLENKEGTLGELFNLFNWLFDRNKQMIFTSSKSHKKLIKTADIIKQRYAIGLIVKIKKHSRSELKKIFRIWLDDKKINIDDYIIEIFMNYIDSITELKTLFNSIILTKTKNF